MTVIRENRFPIIYPTSDGKPMADNTVQFNWLVKIKQGLEKMAQNQDIFVAGDLLWYPKEGDNKIRVAPDVMVAIGRPKGDRGSYLQWREANIAPQIAIEILSPGNRPKEMSRKLAFYEKYGIQEYIIYDPHKNRLSIYERNDERLLRINLKEQKWISSLLGFYLIYTAETLTFFHPDNTPFKTYEELDAAKVAAENKANKEYLRANKEYLRANKELQEKLLLIQKLKELGVNPDDILGR